MKIEIKEYEDKMVKSIEVYEETLSSVRAGRANPSLLSRVKIDYYGALTAISEVATIKVTDARTIVVQPYGSDTLKAIEKAILTSDLGITPQNDGKIIRIAFPQLTEERRKELKKQVAKMAEEAKVAIRNIRREANDKCKELKKDSEMSEDEQKQSEKLTQDLTDKFIKEIDTITTKKDKEIMDI